jgi:UDP-4-amino-4,6-dideoxy-N-acetyl-beta-L-altrosamine N-acetyltransferase
MSVHLRRLRAADRDRLLAWRNSPEVAAYMYSDHAISPDEHARWLASALSAEDRRFWIIELDGAPVGLANLARIDRGASRCDWAFYLADPSTRGRGVGAAVEYLVLGQVFEGLQLNKLWCEVLVENEGVWRLHEGFGFTREALYRDHVCKGGTFRDVVGLGMLRRDWPDAKARAEARLARAFDLMSLSLQP